MSKENSSVLKVKLLISYKILGVHPWAPIEVIHAAKNALLKKFHPDKAPVSLCKFSTKMCVIINDAYDTVLENRKKFSFNRGAFFSSILSSGDGNDST